MADYAALQEQNKLSALRAMAAGTPDPYAGSSGVISGAQDEALNRYAGDAAGRGAPQGSVSQGEAMIRAPGDAALAGLGASGSALAANLAALKAEAENAAANPSSVPQYSSSARSGRQPTKDELQRAAGYNQYGGYNTAAEYENAALGRATEMQAERGAQAEQGKAQAGEAYATASAPAGIEALKAQQAANAAVVGGPGAVIHGIGWKDNPTPWTPPPLPGTPPAPEHDFPKWREAGDPFYKPQPAPPPLTFGPPDTTRQVTNYTPEQTAMLRAAANQSYGRYANIADITPGGPRLAAQTWDPRITQAEDPRNIYEYAQRAAVNELGGDAYEAMGRFSPDWGMKTYALPGLTGPSNYQAAQNEALERSANAQNPRIGPYTDAEVRSRKADLVRSTPDYATGVAVADRQLSSLVGGPKSNHPVTLDGLKVALAEAGVDPEAAVQVLIDKGRLYPNVGFYTQPEEQAQAAANAGSNPATSAGNASG